MLLLVLVSQARGQNLSVGYRKYWLCVYVLQGVQQTVNAQILWRKVERGPAHSLL